MTSPGTTTTTPARTLGRSGPEVSALGLGCWAIGGPWSFSGAPAGWSAVDDEESVRALRRAHELGVTFFDTAANYGAGRSERVLGRAFAGHRDEVVLATKFGYAVHEDAAAVTAYDPAEVAVHVRRDLHASLRRLGTDHVDLFQLHVGDLPVEPALAVREVLDDLVDEGLVRAYGWSTDDVEAARAFVGHPGCAAVQHGLSVLDTDDGAMLRLCEDAGLASVNRSPLGMGLLTGKFHAGTSFPDDDQRRLATWHPGFRDGRPTADWLDRLASVREVLTSDGRTPAQGALAWIWARSPVTVPIPGFKSVAQVEEDCGALAHGPLAPAQVEEVDRLLGRGPRTSPGDR